MRPQLIIADLNFLVLFAESFGDFKYTISGNFTILKNEVVGLGEGVNPIRSGFFTDETFAGTRTEAGYPVASFYGFLVDGIYQSQEEIDAEGLEGRDINPGDLKFCRPGWRWRVNHQRPDLYRKPDTRF